MVAELLAMDKPESSADDDWRIPVPVSQLQAWHARVSSAFWVLYVILLPHGLFL